MDIKIGDILRTRNNKKGFKVLGKGTSYGYDLINLRNNKKMYDIIVRKNHEGSQYYNIDTKSSGTDYRVGDRKQFNSGEYGTLVNKNENGTISIEFDNGKTLKFLSIHAFHRGYATSDREEGKEYEVEIGDVFTFNKYIKGTVISTTLGSPKYVVDIGGKNVTVACNKYFPQELLKMCEIQHVLLGEKMTYDDGLVGTIEDVENMSKILVSFSNGKDKIMTYERFKDPRPVKFERKPTINCGKIIYGVTRVYQKNIGMYATVRQKIDSEKIEVEFEDGSIEIVNRKGFKNGTLCKRNRRKPVLITVGEKIIQNDGRVAEVIKVHKGRLIDVKFDDGEIRTNVSGGDFRVGSVTKGLTASLKYKMSQKYNNKPTVFGLRFSLKDLGDNYAIILWNGLYEERIDRRYYSSIQTPSCFTYSKKNNKLYYKNIEISKYTFYKKDILIEGVCTICKKPIKAYVSEMEFGHNCLENGIDSLGCEIDVEKTGTNSYVVTYLDGYKNVINRLNPLSPENSLGVYYKGIKNVRGCGAYLCGGKRIKVLCMYYDKDIKKYRAVLQYDTPNRKKIRRLEILE